ncbi:hypothetical protein Gohar_027500 [Gossypium harknessii]|uniref:Reverse transcriptase zinc-binding domain-containing protein n=1 Tax=Gossypium harknessii TaxID=34285 RepID=A0A7J9HUZ1_9ROSI|nr:hypothetical protein [Gossypium harknessii]
MVIGDGAWNLDLFRVWLLEEVIKRIEEIPSPHSAAEVDRIIWGGTSTGSFLVKSAYEKLRESSWNPKEVWLLTNMERVRRGLGHITTCGVCGYIFEDVLYAIKNCPRARNIWNHLVPVERHDRGYDNMLIQTDSLEAVKVIQESPSNGSNSTLVRRIHPLWSWIGHWSVWHISG